MSIEKYEKFLSEVDKDTPMDKVHEAMVKNGIALFKTVEEFDEFFDSGEELKL